MILRTVGGTIAIGLAVLSSTVFIRNVQDTVVASPQCTPATPPAPAVPSQDSTPPPIVSVPAQASMPADENLPGDIPDTQAFISYTSVAGGYEILMPEGWAREERGPSVRFADTLHSFSIDVFCADAPPTIETAMTTELPALAQQIPGFALIRVEAVDLPAGPAILIRYHALSAPDQVTGKQHRTEVDRYELFKEGRLVVISLEVPAGSDNVDVSNLVARSFRWTT
ncbi:MAG: hypothetical protein C4346_11550 [Chloroflexota bacterium]